MDFFSGATSRVGCPLRCSTLRWCLKNETSLVVVSMRRMRANLSYSLSEHEPNLCLMQVPSMRVLSREPISAASCGVIFLPRKVATCSALTDKHRLAGELLVQRSAGSARS